MTKHGGMRICVALLYFTLFVGIKAQLKASDYIIQVDSICPKKPEGKATVTVVTDIPDASPVAYCRHAFMSYPVSPTTPGQFAIPVSFKGKDKDGCVFSKSESGQIYTIEVYVPLSGDMFTSSDLPHLITCSYEDTGVQESDPTVFSNALKPVEESLYNMGKISKSDVDLYLEDLTNKRIASGVPLGNTVRLVANLKGSHADEVSFQTVSCRAIGSGSSYSILMAGCGDGIVISKSKGFVTKGKRAISPYFRSFRLRGSRSLVFDCTFAICKKNCDGNSCVNKKRPKREVRYIRILKDGSQYVLQNKDIIDLDHSKYDVPIEAQLNATMNRNVEDSDGSSRWAHFSSRRRHGEIEGQGQTTIEIQPRLFQKLEQSEWWGMDLVTWALLSISMGFTLLTVHIIVVITRRILNLFQDMMTMSTLRTVSTDKTQVSVVGLCEK